MACNEPVVASDGLGNAAPEYADLLAPAFEIHAVGLPRLTDHFAGHRGDLAALRVLMQRRRKLRCDVDLWRRGGGAFLHLAADRPDESVAAARHRFDPTVAAGRLAERPTQRRDLHREVAILDGLAGPCRLDQGFLRNHRPRSLNE